MSRTLPFGLLLAASSLSAQIVISGSGGLGNEIYSTAINTTGGTTLSLAFQAEYLVLGGGGGGGGSGTDSSAWGSGGGGAGGMRTGSFNLSSVSADNNFAVTVGDGGAGGTRSNTSSARQGTNGGASVLGTITALGGGGGGDYKVAGNTGASGGGGGGRGTGNNLRTAGGAGTAGQGTAGGASRDDDSTGRVAGGGGGGAGGVGGSGGTDVSDAGDGGDGLASAISGTSRLYAAGGGGGAFDTFTTSESPGTGGSGIGGNGTVTGNGSAGAANTGSGGGGVGSQGAGGAGGSGVVIVRYKGSGAASGAVAGTGTSAGYSVHTFSTTGNTSLNFSSLNQDTRLGSVVSSDISGSGALTINTLGTIRYTGTATHTGGTVLSDGNLQLGNGGAEGALSGAVTLASGTALEYNRSADGAFSSLSGSGDVTKKGAGRLAIGGSGGHTGKVTLSAGTLALGSSSALGAGTVDVAAGTTLASDSSAARSLSRDINFLGNATLGSATDNGVLAVSGAVNLGGERTLTVASDVALSGVLSNGMLRKAGAGKLTLSGANTYASSTVVTAGTLVIDGSISSLGGFVANGATLQVGSGGTTGSLGSASMGVNVGGALVFDRSDDNVLGNYISGSYSSSLQRSEVVKRGSGKLTLTNANDFYGRFDVREGELVVDRGGASSSHFVWATISAGATLTSINTFPTGASTYYSAILNSSGAGQLVLKGTNGASAYSTSALASSLAHTGGTVLDGSRIVLSGVNALAQGSTLTVRGGGGLMGGSYNLGSVTIEDGFLVMNSLTATSLQFDKGYFYGSLEGATPLVKSGTGELRLNSHSNGRTGTNRIEGGILAVISVSSLGQGATTVAGGSLRFRLGASSTARMSTLVLDGGAVDFDVALGDTRYLDAQVLDLRSGTIGVSLIGKGALTKTGAGTVTLERDSSDFAGSVTVSEGILRVLDTRGLGRTSSILLEGGSIELSGTTRVGYFEQTGGAVTGGTLVSSLILTESGTFGSVLADDVGGSSGILKRTAGTTEVTAANTFTGGIKIQQGTLRLAGAGAFNAASRLTTSSGAILQLGGKSQVLSGIEGEGAIELGNGGALTVSSGVVASTFSGAISGDGTLTKSGASSLTLSGTNTHTGGTSVLGGKLVVNGTLGSGTLGVASGAALGGSGTIAGATVISGVHAPGNSPGLQAFGTSLTYQSGAEIQWELAGHTDAAGDRGVLFDGIDVSGDLTFSGPTLVTLAFALTGSSVDWADSFWSANRSWKLLDVGGSVFGLESLTLGDASALLDSQGETFGTSLDGAQFALAFRSGDIYVDYTAAIPEPSTYGLILGALALAGAAVRRRRAKRD